MSLSKLSMRLVAFVLTSCMACLAIAQTPPGSSTKPAATQGVAATKPASVKPPKKTAAKAPPAPERPAEPRTRPAKGVISTEGKLETLPATAELLQPPAALDNVAGQYAIAKEAPTIDWAILPGQYDGVKLWSNWGDSIQGSDGKFYGTIGDHDDPFGISYVYRIDPATKGVKLVVDCNEISAKAKGKYTGGKIHGPLVEDGLGHLYFATYPGGGKGVSKEYGYEGDNFFKYDEKTGACEDLGPIVPNCGIPVLVLHGPSQMFYGIGLVGKDLGDIKADSFFAYDLKQKKLIYTHPTGLSLNRTIFVAPDGRAYFDTSIKAPASSDAPAAPVVKGKKQPEPTEGFLNRYDPKTNTATLTDIKLPGSGKFRAASRPDKNGVVYGMTQDGVMFAFDTKTEKLTPWGPCFPAGTLYTAVLKLDPTEKYLYYVPASHGGSDKTGSVILQMTIATRQVKVLAFPYKTLKDKFNYHLGGTFGTALSRDGSQMLIVWNGNKADRPKPDFGLCSVMIVNIPASERQ